MKNLTYNLNSVEIFYGDSTLTSVIQIHERINDIDEYLTHLKDPFPEILQKEITDRLEKLVNLNQNIQEELEKQVEKLNTIKMNLNREMKSI